MTVVGSTTVLQDERIGRRGSVEEGCVDAKVLRQDRLGRVGNPVVNVERRASAVKVWVVEAMCVWLAE